MSEQIIITHVAINDIAEVIFDGVLGRPSKRHQLNDFLGFGLSMQDRVLDRPLVGYGMHEFTPEGVEYWAREKVLPYLRHGHSIQDQLVIQSAFQKFFSVFSIMAPSYTVEAKGVEAPFLHYITIQAMVVLLALENLRLLGKENAKPYLLEGWKERWSKLDRQIKLAIAISDEDPEVEWWNEVGKIPSDVFDYVEKLKLLRSDILVRLPYFT